MIDLVSLRKKKNLTQRQVAEKSGISVCFLSQIETGNRKPSVKVAKQIANALKFSWTTFFKED